MALGKSNKVLRRMFRKEDLLTRGSFAQRRLRCLVSFSTRLGSLGGQGVPRHCLRNGGVTLLFRGTSAHAETTFAITTVSLKTRPRCLKGGSVRLNGGRSIRSATGMLNDVFSNVRFHNFDRGAIRSLTGCTNMPM